PSKGSIFTSYLPRVYTSGMVPPRTLPPVLTVTSDQWPKLMAETTAAGVEPAALMLPVEIPDDREHVQEGDKVLLIVEDDAPFLLDLAREKGCKGLVASAGESGLALARRFKPAAITLDLQLPDNDGWTILDRLKHDPATRHIPVHIISVEEARQRGLKQGAFGVINKPCQREWLEKAFDDMLTFIERPSKNLLIIEDDTVQRSSIVE